MFELVLDGRSLVFRCVEVAAVAIQHLRSSECSQEGPRALPGTFGLSTSFRLYGVEEKKRLKSLDGYLDDDISYPKGK